MAQPLCAQKRFELFPNSFLAARLRIGGRALRTGEVRRRQLLLPGAAIDGPMDSYVSLC